MLALTRQNLPQLRTAYSADNLCAAGAYEIMGVEGDNVDVSIFATGSEVAIAVEAAQLLNRQGKPARVVSVPCFELFLSLPAEQRHPILGGAEVNVAVEAGIRQGWDEIIGSNGVFVGMSGFGASAPVQGPLQPFRHHAGGGGGGGAGQVQAAINLPTRIFRRLRRSQNRHIELSWREIPL